MKLSSYSFTSNRVEDLSPNLFFWIQTLPEIDSYSTLCFFHPCRRFDDVCYSSNVLNSPEFKSARRSFWLVCLLLGGVEQPLAEWEAWGYTVYYSAFHTTPAGPLTDSWARIRGSNTHPQIHTQTHAHGQRECIVLLWSLIYLFLCVPLAWSSILRD